MVSQLIEESVDLPGQPATLRDAADCDLPSSATFFPSPEKIGWEIAAVLAVSLSADLEPWVARYSQVGHRDRFLWKWCRRGVEVTTQSCVDPKLFDRVCDTKVLGVVLDVLLDDVADHERDLGFLEHILNALEGGPRVARSLSPRQQAYAQFTVDVWHEIQQRVRNFPRYDEFVEVLDFDYRQLFNVMRYSRLVNVHPEMLNLVEHDLYLPHNMHMMISSTIDLMCSPGFDRGELGLLREAIWRAQCMGRIGNLTTTWQREIGEEDFTSGVFARAICCGDLTAGDLWSGNRNYIETVIQEKKHEEFFLRRWQTYRQEIMSLATRCRSANLAELVAGLQRLICLHLGSRGKK